MNNNLEFTRKFLGEEIADTIFLQSAIRNLLTSHLTPELSEQITGEIMDMVLSSNLCKEKHAEFYETVKRNHAKREDN